MNPFNRITCIALPLALSACAGGSGPSGPEPPPAGTTPAETAELEALFEERRAEALENVHPGDVEFVTGMIGHHAQALTMSGYAPEAGASPSIQTLAARIINAQRDEITNMQRWLSDRDLPVPQVAEDGTVTPTQGAGGAMDHGGMGHAGMDHGAMGHEGMPGMLTPEQLDELSRSRGREFDRLFLTYMIQHHQGAVTMVHDLFAQDGAAQDETIFKLASDIQVDQITEISRMQLMLDEMSSPPGR
jgi:uncharacterized protein (DUF305 family)